MTAKERLIFYWTGEVKEHYKEWKQAQENGDEEKARIEKQRYIDAKKTLESL